MLKTYKTAVITTGRADYGLLYPLIKKLVNSNKYEVSIIATGSHLSQAHGMTINEIEKDNFEVGYKIEMTQKNDSNHDICKAVSAGLEGFSKAFRKIKPDFIIVLGDRYELWSACVPAVIHKIPIVHIHGGEATYGLIDDSVRNCVTKMASFHFTSIMSYAKRIIQMGEKRDNVFVVGALGIDNIKNIKYLTLKELSDFIGLNFEDKIAIMTFHPVTLEKRELAKHQVENILNSLLRFELSTIITMPNSDPAGILLYQEIHKYVLKYPQHFKFIKSLGQKTYLSVLKYAKLMIGNSSSGILESASFKLPVVNVGDRQAGRFKPDNIINANNTEQDISNAIKIALSDEFKQSISNLENPYGDGNTASNIMNILNSLDFNNKETILKKGFQDLQFDY